MSTPDIKGGFGRCQACYMRGHRNGAFPKVTIGARYPVECDQCGVVGEATERDEARQLRNRHLDQHGAGPVNKNLSDADVARLRRLVGVA